MPTSTGRAGGAGDGSDIGRLDRRQVRALVGCDRALVQNDGRQEEDRAGRPNAGVARIDDTARRQQDGVGRVGEGGRLQHGDT